MKLDNRARVSTRRVLVLATVCAVVASTLFVAGCGKKREEAPPPPQADNTPTFMKDPVFRAKLDAQDKKRNTILGQREQIIQEFEALEKRAGTRAAAEKLPEWKALEARAQACGRAFESNRMETTRLLRDRMKRDAAAAKKSRRTK